jgi:hypothetical protein
MDSSTRLGDTVEDGTVAAWLLANRRLTVRHERRADILTAFCISAALTCSRKLRPS